MIIHFEKKLSSKRKLHTLNTCDLKEKVIKICIFECLKKGIKPLLETCVVDTLVFFLLIFKLFDVLLEFVLSLPDLSFTNVNCVATIIYIGRMKFVNSKKNWGELKNIKNA